MWVVGVSMFDQMCCSQSHNANLQVEFCTANAVTEETLLTIAAITEHMAVRANSSMVLY